VKEIIFNFLIIKHAASTVARCSVGLFDHFHKIKNCILCPYQNFFLYRCLARQHHAHQSSSQGSSGHSPFKTIIASSRPTTTILFQTFSRREFSHRTDSSLSSSNSFSKILIDGLEVDVPVVVAQTINELSKTRAEIKSQAPFLAQPFHEWVDSENLKVCRASLKFESSTSIGKSRVRSV
jgi:hypothetical protein